LEADGDIALAQVTQHDLIFNRWGLGERHPTGLALAFNFAGPPGTGKTICAEAIAARRSTSVDHRFELESNTVVSVLLQEFEWYNGVVIFATNFAANFDPALERRIRTLVLFEMPGEAERVRIWRVQLHPARPPLATDNFELLARLL
jgi:SpoVK/Ycf46/Vps4 family AAA+-type ATPase